MNWRALRDHPFREEAVHLSCSPSSGSLHAYITHFATKFLQIMALPWDTSSTGLSVKLVHLQDPGDSGRKEHSMLSCQEAVVLSVGLAKRINQVPRIGI